jgi:hypothetical protein
MNTSSGGKYKEGCVKVVRQGKGVSREENQGRVARSMRWQHKGKRFRQHCQEFLRISGPLCIKDGESNSYCDLNTVWTGKWTRISQTY